MLEAQHKGTGVFTAKDIPHNAMLMAVYDSIQTNLLLLPLLLLLLLLLLLPLPGCLRRCTRA
jgi:hypothetical protein